MKTLYLKREEAIDRLAEKQNRGVLFNTIAFFDKEQTVIANIWRWSEKFPRANKKTVEVRGNKYNIEWLG